MSCDEDSNEFSRVPRAHGCTNKELSNIRPVIYARKFCEPVSRLLICGKAYRLLQPISTRGLISVKNNARMFHIIRQMSWQSGICGYSRTGASGYKLMERLYIVFARIFSPVVSREPIKKAHPTSNMELRSSSAPGRNAKCGAISTKRSTTTTNGHKTVDFHV